MASLTFISSWSSVLEGVGSTGPNGAAHCEQKFASGAFSRPHLRHRLFSAVAHWLQNRPSSALSVPHSVQRIATTFPEADGQVSRLGGLIGRREYGWTAMRERLASES